MATTTESKHAAEHTFDQLRDASEQVLAASRKAGHVYLDTYESAVDSAIEQQRAVTELTGQSWLKSLVEANAKLARELTGTYTATARALLK